ncbi:MAG: DUF92 domain-containing protein [Bacteroidota bacterium]|nr:DUF92 domain-containing protein [Bacteroidota bacterium]MDP4232879.1 DUF92 domain-containing protein [Bacteroidota bacterium]MDP4241923.1 DUF92 domain-containing protein [Bacteroidota bacterium]MDP4286826.1 DUF92 domain-containing protein [Bacteroidota bacterium]
MTEANLLLGFCLAGSISFGAWRFRALDRSGAIAALLMGTIVFGFGGLAPSVALITFFLTGSIFSALPGGIRMPTGDETSGRSWKQVTANGLIPVLAILTSWTIPAIAHPATIIALGGIAAGTADSWATELGTRYGGPARDILTHRPSPPGASGGISVRGIGASLIGAFVIAFVGLFSVGHAQAWDILAVTVGGFLGAVGDSIIGSLIQARYLCPVCNSSVETPIHCTSHTLLVAGNTFVTNNVVNFAATTIGAIFSIVILDFGQLI